jgi:hypothetical protein
VGCTRERLPAPVDSEPSATGAASPAPTLAGSSDAPPTAAPERRGSSAPGETPTPAPGFAVVELFTSEGCSSCPPADDLLASLREQAERSGKPVFVLSFHVDYWDSLGWPDPFAAPAYTERQQAYGRALGQRGIYTPQMVVNGVEAFVGSDRAHATSAIEQALARPAGAALSLAPVVDATRAAGAITVRYRISGAPLASGGELSLALVERGLESRVARGENAGRTLRHENVVRAFAQAPASPSSGQIALVVPRGINRARASLVGYVRAGASMSVVAAASAGLPAGG